MQHCERRRACQVLSSTMAFPKQTKLSHSNSDHPQTFPCGAGQRALLDYKTGPDSCLGQCGDDTTRPSAASAFEGCRRCLPLSYAIIDEPSQKEDFTAPPRSTRRGKHGDLTSTASSAETSHVSAFTTGGPNSGNGGGKHSPHSGLLQIQPPVGAQSNSAGASAFSKMRSISTWSYM